MATKKLINKPENCVDECLEGFVAAQPSLQLLKGARVVVRKDISDCVRSGKVALVCGGGSGHEPVFAGYVGRGGLTAAIAGSVFASPPPADILSAIKVCENAAGVLVIVFNYTGDRLNFGLAFERAKHLCKCPLRLVVIGEDCAQTGAADRSAGRRGMAGGLLAIKIAGALSEAGKPLDYVAQAFEETAKNLGTIGLSLSSCSVPGCSPTFHLASDEVELGLGVHGEPGVRRLKMLPAKELVSVMLEHMFDSASPTRFELGQSKEAALMVNNLGSTTNLEMGIVCREALRYLGDKGVIIRRLLCAPFFTSLEMHGVQLSLLNLTEERLCCLDAETNSPAWPKCTHPPAFYEHKLAKLNERIEVKVGLDEVAQKESIEVTLALDDCKRLIACVVAACEALAAPNTEELLNSLDRACGDGDCGATMKRGGEALSKELSANMEDYVGLCSRSPVRFCEKLSLLWEGSTGGTTGPIYSLLISSAAKALTEGGLTRVSFGTALKAGTAVIMQYGGAKPGDRTMVDALEGAYTAVQAPIAVAESSQEFFERVTKATEVAAESTKTMLAKAGRASYVERKNLTMPDAGATAVAIWLRAACDHFKRIR